MSQLILHHNGAYNLFSTNTERMCFESALTLEQLQFVIRNDLGTTGIEELPRRLALAHKSGCSGRIPGLDSLDRIIQSFREADGSRVSKEQFIERFLTLSEQAMRPEPEEARKHPHAQIICAWVNGARIQGQSPTTDEWIDVPDANTLSGGAYLEPNPLHPEYCWWENWRIKP